VEGELVVTEADHRRLDWLIRSRRGQDVGDESALARLEATLASARVVAPTEVPVDMVTMNSKVVLRIMEEPLAFEVTLVFPGAASARDGKVSILAPEGLALLGAREGDCRDWPTSNGPRRVRLERVRFQPEACRRRDL